MTPNVVALAEAERYYPRTPAGCQSLGGESTDASRVWQLSLDEIALAKRTFKICRKTGMNYNFYTFLHFLPSFGPKATPCRNRLQPLNCTEKCGCTLRRCSIF